MSYIVLGMVDMVEQVRPSLSHQAFSVSCIVLGMVDMVEQVWPSLSHQAFTVSYIVLGRVLNSIVVML